MSEQEPITVKCPHCGTEWELDDFESRQPHFTCGTCKTTFSIDYAHDLEAGEAGDPAPPLPPTRLSQLVVVVLRLLTLSFLLDAFTFMLNALTAVIRVHASPLPELIILLVMGLLGGLMWFFSPAIARLVVRNQESSAIIGSLTLADLYSAIFLIVGLYFAVDSLGPTLTWFHYSLLQAGHTEAALTAQQQGNFYTLFKYLTKLLIGLWLVFNGRKLAGRLIRYQEKSTEVPGQQDG
jgi:hypothetical protein